MPYQTADARKEFDAWSARYDHDPLQVFFFRPAHELLLGRLTAADRSVLDVGCGTGRFAEQVVERFPQTRVTGLDLSDGMLRQAAARCRAAGGVDLVQADSGRLPFADGVFDVVTCVHSFHHYPRQDVVLAELCRVLRPGGRLLLIDGDRDCWWGRLLYDGLVVLMEGPVRHLAAGTFRRLLRQAGFAGVRLARHGAFLPALIVEAER